MTKDIQEALSLERVSIKAKVQELTAKLEYMTRDIESVKFQRDTAYEYLKMLEKALPPLPPEPVQPYRHRVWDDKRKLFVEPKE